MELINKLIDEYYHPITGYKANEKRLEQLRQNKINTNKKRKEANRIKKESK